MEEGKVLCFDGIVLVNRSDDVTCYGTYHISYPLSNRLLDDTYPNKICVPSDKFVPIQPVNGWWSLDSLLLSVDEDGHILFLPAFLFCLLSGSKFSFALCHDEY
jgi:hypothetical protein